ncbi:Protein of unknown function DUF187 [Raphidiopsis brookii D9]|nr:Protein of unknown function DUF187 [Raphidiopsis brookii D9]
MAPADSLLAQARPEWITTRRDGTKIVKEGIHDRVWLNPFHPEVQKFMENLIVEIVRNYDIDGIQFDDHFGLPSELGYDSYTVGLYKQEHQGKAPSENFQDPEWVKWRADKITNLMKRVFFAIKANKKELSSFCCTQSPKIFLRILFSRLAKMGTDGINRRTGITSI